ncbi:TetR/AcrR family transcriptional regulator [Proteiniborus sp.]|uniref:TetR/AcrR family transcriptional regulator n=1 Tax=Proteiniborus sp. TaxID=2079015 RepID=UPI0033314FF7
MPKNTFFNLPKDKINKIIEVSIDEFAEYSYNNASINRIVEAADIAKGSFYQYFEDKKDLYKYIIEEAEKKKLSYLMDVVDKQYYSNYFKSLKELYLAEMKFAMNSPKLSIIILDLEKSNDNSLKREILGDTYNVNKVYEELLLKGIDNRDISDDIDIKLNTFLLGSLNISILEYYMYEVNLDFEQATKYIDNIVELFKNGIKDKKRLVRNVEDRFY